MPKQLYTEAPKSSRASIDALFASGDTCGAIVLATELGFDTPEPSLALDEQLTALREAGELVSAAEFAARHGNAIDIARRAHAMWLGRRAWAMKPSAGELAVAMKAEQEASARAAAVEQRTLEILAAAEAETRAKRLASAKRQAEKEVG